MARGTGGLPQQRHGALARVPLAPAAAQGIAPQRPRGRARPEMASWGQGGGGAAAQVAAQDVGVAQVPGAGTQRSPCPLRLHLHPPGAARAAIRQTETGVGCGAERALGGWQGRDPRGTPRCKGLPRPPGHRPQHLREQTIAAGPAQAWPWVGRRAQLARSGSLPLHSKAPSQSGPVAAPKWPAAGTATAVPQPSSLHTTWAALRSTWPWQTVAQARP